MEDDFIRELREWMINNPLTKQDYEGAVQGKNLGKEVWTGQKHTAKTRKKMSRSNRNKVLCFNTITGEKIKVSQDEFDSNEHLVGINANKKMKSRPEHSAFMKAHGKVPSFKGGKHTDEYKKNASETMKRIWNERKNNANKP